MTPRGRTNTTYCIQFTNQRKAMCTRCSHHSARPEHQTIRQQTNKKKHNETWKQWAFSNDKSKKLSCVPSESSDQPGHPSWLIRVFAVRMQIAWVLCYPLFANQILIRLGGSPGWSESSLGAHAVLFPLSWGGSLMKKRPWFEQPQCRTDK